MNNLKYPQLVDLLPHVPISVSDYQDCGCCCRGNQLGQASMSACFPRVQQKAKEAQEQKYHVEEAEGQLSIKYQMLIKKLSWVGMMI